MGPLDVVAIEFPGTRFKGELIRALTGAVATGALRIIDLTFVSKDASGAVATYELAELEEHEAVLFDNVDMTLGVLSVGDIQRISANLAAGSSAALMVIEHRWAV